MVEIIKCVCHGETKVDVRSWPNEENVPTNHYFCIIAGDGTVECEVTITKEIL